MEQVIRKYQRKYRDFPDSCSTERRLWLARTGLILVLAGTLIFGLMPVCFGQSSDRLNDRGFDAKVDRLYQMNFDYESLGEGPYSTFSSRNVMTVRTEQKGKLILHEDFSKGMENWWVEGGENVWVENERLHVKADPEDLGDPRHVATVWHRKPISGNVRIEMKAHVISSTVGANNINIFFFYSDPDGRPLYETRNKRTDAGYRHYHDLNGYIMTFLRDRNMKKGKTPEGNAYARFRLRRCPGFNLVNQTYDDIGVREGQTYNLAITRKDGRITVRVNGKSYIEWEDEEPLEKGLLGLRTFRTNLWWDDIRVYQLD